MKPSFKRIINEGLTVLLGIVIFLVCLFPLRALFNYHEEMHLFRWTGTYLSSHLTSVSGVWEYLVSFVAQFFYIGWLGALVIALLTVGIQRLTWWLMKLARLRHLWFYPLSLIPSLLFFCLVFMPHDYRVYGLVREQVSYDYLERAGQWDAILAQSEGKVPRSLNAIWCTNYALAMTGQLPDRMFSYYQHGPEGLLIEGQKINVLSRLSLSDILFQLGFVNDAERFVFNARQEIKDYHTGGRIYQRLAEAALINGDKAVARKYLNYLKPTLFYRSWANHYLGLLDDDKLLAGDPLIHRMRRLQQKSDDTLEPAKDYSLRKLAEENPQNRMALNYLLAYELLRLDNNKLTDAARLAQRLGMKTLPRPVQECLVGHWMLTHGMQKSCPFPIDKDVYEQTLSFLNIVNRSGSMQDPALQSPELSQTYWHYHAYAKTYLLNQLPQ